MTFFAMIGAPKLDIIFSLQPFQAALDGNLPRGTQLHFALSVVGDLRVNQLCSKEKSMQFFVLVKGRQVLGFAWTIRQFTN